MNKTKIINEAKIQDEKINKEEIIEDKEKKKQIKLSKNQKLIW